MSIPVPTRLDPAKSSFKELFRQINDNFEIISNYLRILGDKIVVESFTGDTDRLINLSNVYTPGKHNLLVFFNGAPQWVGENYTEESISSIRLNFDRRPTDDVRVVIIRSNMIEQDISGYLADLTELVNSSRESLTQVRQIMNTAQLLSGELDQKMQELSSEKAEISHMYEEIQRMYDELSSS